MRRKSWLWMVLVVIVVITVGTLAVWKVVDLMKAKADRAAGDGGRAVDCTPVDVEPANTATKPTSASKPDTGPASTPASGPVGVQALPKMTAATATAAMENGLALYKEGKLIAARTALSEAMLSGLLDAKQEADAQVKLKELSDKTIFSGEVIEDDPYTYYYTVRPGDRLALVERRECDGEGLHIPTQLILKINHIARDLDVREGQRIKLVRGPFHAVISKSHFTVDIFLHREGLDPVWVTRVKCGLGKNGSTPLGYWKVGKELIDGKVTPGGKMQRPTWNPPPSSEVQGPIDYGQPGYALGDKGLWIGLVGIDDNTKAMKNYGIHSTSDPTSIGKQQSLGCVRLADEDIELVYSLLYEVHSTVQTRK